MHTHTHTHMLTITRTHAQTYVHAPAQQVPALLPLKETAVQEDQEAHLLETQRGAVHTRHWVLLGRSEEHTSELQSP